ncbi:MAG: SLC13 family permease, partial [Bacillota bacterium]|nr:SLC13 family permease [Bacillota bacterium]
IIPNFLKLLLPTSAFIKTISGPLDIQMLAVVGTFICGILNLGDVKDAITKGIPWNTVFLIAGICTLINVVSGAGLTEWLGAQLNDSVSPSVIIVIFALLAAFMSLFAGAINAVFPMLAAIAIPYAVAAGISPSPMLVAIAVGASATAVSPFSTGGSLAIANCTDESMRDGLFMKEIILAACGAVLCAVLGFVGVFNI